MTEKKPDLYYSDEMPDENLSSGIFRYAAGVEYKGTRYCGWQRQTQRASEHDNVGVHISIQEMVEQAVSYVADEPVSVSCAGRTDKGVHACEQVIHFETSVKRPLKAWVMGVNTQLPEDVSVLWVKQVDSDFNARFSATARTYQYWINNRVERPAIGKELMTWVRYPLDETLMHRAAQCLLGEHDFSSFRGASCQSNTPFRYVEKVEVRRSGRSICVEIKANAFLHHMVRNIVGSLIEVGRGERTPAWIYELLSARDRNKAGVTAPPEGLYLMKVDFPESLQLPQLPPETQALGQFMSYQAGLG